MFFRHIDLKIRSRKLGSTAFLGGFLRNLNIMDQNVQLESVLEACISALWLCPEPAQHTVPMSHLSPLQTRSDFGLAPKSRSGSS